METMSIKKVLMPSMLELISKLRHSVFFKNVFIVMSGTAVAQMIGFALTPIISRLYSPSDFGVFGSFIAVLTVCSAGATLQYSQAIMLPKAKEDAINLFYVSCLCTFLMGFLILAGCLVAPSTLNGLMKTDGVWALSLLIFSTVVTGLNQSCQAWSVRVKAFKHTSASQVIRSLSSSGTRIGFGIFNGGSFGLIVSVVLADLMASLNLLRVLIPDLLSLRQYIRWTRIKALAKEYMDFPIYSASQNVINALSNGLPVLLLMYYYGIAVAGAYAFGVNMLNVPMSFVLTALRQVLFQKAGETQNLDGSLASLYLKTTTSLFAMALLPSLILIIWAPQIFTWIFGTQWLTAGEFARSLIVWMMFGFCNLPAVLFARIIRIQRFVFFYDLALLALRSMALVFGGLYLNAWHTIVLFSLAGAAMNLFLILLVGYAVLKKEGHTDWEGIRNFLIG